MTEESLFDLLLDTPEAERAALLDRECAGDPALRGRVEALLAADAVGDVTLSQPGERTASYSPPPPPLGAAGTVVAGRYRLAEPIGEGGMGSVWLAHQTEPVRRKVAVKLVKAGMDSKAVLARFDAERQALAVMDHPNIAKVLDGGLHDGRPFFVMELVKGVPITHYCDARRLTPRQRLELFVPVCQAIQHAHQKGIIHRDIKPNNVLVALYDDRPVPKVIDFGLAKATGGGLTDLSAHTAFGGVVGTPQYMSPEQASLNNLDIDTRSDVYSLGVLLYELLAGSPPFKTDELKRAGLMEVLRVVREVEPPRPSAKLSTAEALPSLSASRGTDPKRLTGLLRNELDWIVMKALEKDRARRYETANGFAADVTRYLTGEAVLAHPPSATYRVRKFVRRHRTAVGTVAAFVAALVMGLAGTAWQAVRADREAGRARDAEQAARDQQRAAEHAAASLAVDLDLKMPTGQTGLLRLTRRYASLPVELKDLQKFVLICALTHGQQYAALLPDTGFFAEPPDGQRHLHFPTLATPSAEILDIRTSQVAILRQGDERALDAGWSLDGRTVFTEADDGRIRLYDPSDGRLRAIIRPKSRGVSVIAKEMARPSGCCQVCGARVLTIGLRDGRWKQSTYDLAPPVELWDAADGRFIRQLDIPKRDLDTLRFVSEKCVLSRNNDSVIIYSTETGKEVLRLPADTQKVYANPSGTRLVACWPVRKTLRGGLQWIQFWNIGNWQPVSSPCISSESDSGLTQFIADDVFIIGCVGTDECYFNLIRPGFRPDRFVSNWPPIFLSGTSFVIDDELVELRTAGRDRKAYGQRYHPELAHGAADGRFRWVDSNSELADLVVGKGVPAGRIRRGDPHIPGFGFVSSESYPYLLPTSPPDIPPAALELWAQVAVRGELGPGGEFVKWDEPTWERKRQELAAAPAPRPDFPFPGYVATDRLHWLRAEFTAATTDADKVRLATELLRRAEAFGLADEAARWRAELLKLVPEVAPLPRVVP